MTSGIGALVASRQHPWRRATFIAEAIEAPLPDDILDLMLNSPIASGEGIMRLLLDTNIVER